MVSDSVALWASEALAILKSQSEGRVSSALGIAIVLSDWSCGQPHFRWSLRR